MKNFQGELHAYSILKFIWIDIDREKKLNIFFKKWYIKIFLWLIEKISNKKYIKELTCFEYFLFKYYKLLDNNLSFNPIFDKFVSN